MKAERKGQNLDRISGITVMLEVTVPKQTSRTPSVFSVVHKGRFSQRTIQSTKIHVGSAWICLLEDLLFLHQL